MTTKPKPVVDAFALASIRSPLAEAQAAVEQAESVVAKLEAKRAACVKRGTELADERAATALEAHTGNAKAAKRLGEIHTALATQSSELASFDAALNAAGEHHAAAQAAKAREVDRERGY
jgi:hypothetical protein